MAKLNPNEFAEKWARRLSGATSDIKAGIQRVSVAPGQQAAAQQEKMRMKVNEAIDSGRWSRNVAGVSLQDWQTAAGGKGVERIAAGVSNARPKMEQIAAKLLTDTDAAAAAARRLPKVTLEDSINRASVYMRERAARKLRS